MDKKLKLWYRQPAELWTDSLPLGNGRIGAMVFGGIKKERIGLNEDTLWSGSPCDKNNAHAAEYLEQARELCREKKFRQAQELIEKKMQGDYTESYLPLGDLTIEFPEIDEGEVTEYYRDLDLNQAVCHTAYRSAGVQYSREVFVSQPAQMLVMSICADKAGAVSLEVNWSCPLKHRLAALRDELVVEGECPSHVEPSYIPSENPIVYKQEDGKRGIGFGCVVKVVAMGGVTENRGNKLCVTGADRVEIRFAVRTSFHGYNKLPYLEGQEYRRRVREDLYAQEKKSYIRLKQEHVEDYKKYFDRVELSLVDQEDLLPTDIRLRDFDSQKGDKHLYELLFQYGRYLMIAGSREGTQPTNLQGIWNQEMRAPWSSNYTLNINTEMNYWPAEICNLSELHQPLFDMTEELRDTGARTARLHYGAKGVAVHHNSDLWRTSNPVGRTVEGSAGYAYWSLAFGWLCAHLYEHYEYTGDLEFLEKKTYPAIKDAALFYLDMLTEDRNHHLILSPATSPENAFLYEGEVCKVAETTTMSTAIIKEVFAHVIACCRILSVDEEFAELVREKLERLRPYEIGKKGGMMEWDEDFEDVEVTHRHISHLYPLHPGNEITPEKTPCLAEACKCSLLMRGDDGTGWSLGWKMNAWARLRDGNHAEKLLKQQLRFVDTSTTNYSSGGGSYRNLFDAHPPFQIDGNFAASAGIAQLFLQSYPDRILLLPALPDTWGTCYVKGLCAMGNVVLDIYVEDGLLDKAIVHVKHTWKETLQIKYGDRVHLLHPKDNTTYELIEKDFS